MEFLIISGMSGAGKSRVASYLEDMGFFMVDNLPAPLIPKFAEMGMGGMGEYERLGLVSDVRGGANFDGLFQALDTLKTMGCPYTILFMDARDDIIINRYKETRRNHPLSDEVDNLPEAIAKERKALEALRLRADHIIDTSVNPNSKLRAELVRLFGRDGTQREKMEVRVSSFGFKHGAPTDADLVFDVRFLPNPYYLTELRTRTGLEQDVYDYVFQNGQAQEFMTRLEDLLTWLLPNYVEEGKATLMIAIGCTGGRHRSVAIAHSLTKAIRAREFAVLESHRDIGKA